MAEIPTISGLLALAGARFLAAAVNAASMHDKMELEEVPDKLNSAYYDKG